MLTHDDTLDLIIKRTYIQTKYIGLHIQKIVQDMQSQQHHQNHKK